MQKNCRHYQFKRYEILEKKLRDSFQVDFETELSKVDMDIVIAPDASTAFDVSNKAFLLVVNY